ncbi:hypothetical protein KAW80_01595 [Candidatus Babeliales bacterium]|nr:hypothetical protein [Candidatus Babeliales bacterium]
MLKKIYRTLALTLILASSINTNPGDKSKDQSRDNELLDAAKKVSLELHTMVETLRRKAKSIEEFEKLLREYIIVRSEEADGGYVLLD